MLRKEEAKRDEQARRTVALGIPVAVAFVALRAVDDTAVVATILRVVLLGVEDVWANLGPGHGSWSSLLTTNFLEDQRPTRL